MTVKNLKKCNNRNIVPEERLDRLHSLAILEGARVKFFDANEGQSGDFHGKLHFPS